MDIFINPYNMMRMLGFVQHTLAIELGQKKNCYVALTRL